MPSAAEPTVEKTPTAHEAVLLHQAVAATLVKFSVPLLTTNLLGALTGTWGAIWVSHILGQNALTAVANANIFMGMMNGAVMGVGSAAGIAVGQTLGAGDTQASKRVVATSVTFIVLASLLMAAIGLLFAPAILDLIHLPQVARPMAITYFQVTSLSLPFAFTFNFLMMVLRGTGDARTPFRFTLFAIALNLVLTPLLLTGALGFPKLGIAGAAVAALIASAVPLIASIIYIYAKNMAFALRGEDLALLKTDPDLLAMLMKRGAPMAFESFVIQGAYFVLLTMVNAHGAATAAAYSAAAQLWGYVQMPSGAVGASMSAMAAMSIGANRWDRVGEIALKGCLVAGGLTLISAAVVFGLGDLPLKLFLPKGGEALRIAREINAIVLFGWIALSITNGLSSMVRANSAMLAPTLIYAVTMWLFRVPFAKAMEPHIGAAGIWWSFPVGTISSALLALAYYRWGGWRSNALMTTGVGKRA